jgi:magnesium chelatase family protein
LLDRIDIHLTVPPVPTCDLSTNGPFAEPSAAIRARVEAARQIQQERLQAQSGVYGNAHMSPRDVRRHCRLVHSADALLRQAISTLGLSARAYTRVLKLARTIADLAGQDEIASVHVSEAIQYRLLDRLRRSAPVR